jgi:Uncharacterized protein conserved in bacteria (DUF2272)/Mannosyl-glycoprotein endo-beta-N-acetylglucosaminidase/Putative peptidoglycan binding domain
MNTLMRFNPEPFDMEYEDESPFGLEAEGEAFEQEEEMRGGRGRPRSRQFRSTSKGGSIKAFHPARTRFDTKGSASTRNSVAWPKGRRRRWDYPAWDSLWPYAVADGAPADFGVLPSEHVSWVQATLNDALGLRLPVDGVMNAPTRSAIRLFQKRRGLAINGRLSPETEAALRAAGSAAGPPSSAPPPADAGPPDAPPQSAEPPAGPATAEDAGEFEGEFDLYHHPWRSARMPAASSTPAASTPSIKTLREKIVRIAQHEVARWKNGGLQETDPKVAAILQAYWKSGPGLSFTTAQLGSKDFQASHPWSAAFICFVMRKAGAGKAFKYASSHSVYISAAKANRIAGNANPFKAYRLNEVAPRTGDIICRSRAGSKATYDTIHPSMKTHCDIVVAVKPGALTVVGGNVGNSVKSRTVRTDAVGRVTEPLVFAVIRIGTHKPPMPGDPSVTPVTPLGPAPGPGPVPTPPPVLPKGPSPNLLKQESSPPAATLYPEIDLGIVDRFKGRAAPMTGIFLPDGFTPDSSVDVILYLHGHKAEGVRDLTIDQYWNSKRFAYGAFREKLNAAGRRVILVAPTLGARSEAGKLLEPGGLDAFLAKILATVGATGPGARGGVIPTLRHLIFACHSGGGLPMRKLAGGNDKALASLRECWGFDCTYNGGDDSFWANWARKRPNAKCYFYYIKGSQTAALSESLSGKRVPNAVVQPAKDSRHNYVPITHWLERIQGAAFLGALAGGGTAPPIAPTEPSDEPADLKSLSHAAFIEFVGLRARKAMAATGVPASVTVAQAIIETGWGKHTIGSAKNLFGIKGKGPAGTVRVPTREFVNGTWVTIEADFAKYDSFAQSITEHARFFLKNKRYKAALKGKDDPDAFARAIQKAGYATAPDYADQLIKVMKAHDLYRFDR